MKHKSIAILIFCASLAATAQAQTVTGSGTPGTLPIFTGPSTIGNSPIFQLGGSTSIGATNERLGTKFQVITDSTISPQPGQGPDAIFGQATGNADFTTAIFGVASGSSGLSNGVVGQSFNGAGVVGLGKLHGVVGATDTTTTFAEGVRGEANGTSGGSVGVLGINLSPQGDAGRFISANNGTILRGSAGQPGFEVTEFRVDSKGTVFADGGFRPFGADFAESLAVKGNRAQYAPGDLLVIDSSGERRLALSQTPYSTLVAGIYSTKPGVVASQHRMDDPSLGSEVPLAVVGIVPCKVTAENGPIAVGDLLVTSSTPGHAMKGTDRSKMLGAVVGKALEPLADGKGVIQVLVTLQ